MKLAIFLSFVLSLRNMAAQNVINVKSRLKEPFTLQKVSPFPKSIRGTLSGYPMGTKLRAWGCMLYCGMSPEGMRAFQVTPTRFM